MVKRLCIIAATLLLMVGPAAAQGFGTNILPDAPTKTPEQIERDQAIERDYKETLKKIPDGKASNDPWGNVRGAEATRTPAKPKVAPAKSTQAKNAQTKAAGSQMKPQ
jgi:hypothetical protein